MTIDELKAEVARRRAAGLDWMQLKVPGRMRSERKRVLAGLRGSRGLYGRALGEEGTKARPITVVDVKLDDVEAWLRDAEAA